MKDLLLAAIAWFPRPVRHYTFEPNTVNGNVLTDLSGTQNGTIVGSPTFGTGQRGNCIKFNGANDYINIGSVSEIRKTGNFTFVFWAKTNYTDSGKLLGIAGNATGRVDDGIFIGFDDRESISRNRALIVFITDASGFNSPAVVDYAVNNILPVDGMYHHYAIVFDDTKLMIYMDGVKVGEQIANRSFSSVQSAMNSLFIGGINRLNSLLYPYQGEIDEFRIIANALTDEQIKRLYQIGQ